MDAWVKEGQTGKPFMSTQVREKRLCQSSCYIVGERLEIAIKE